MGLQYRKGHLLARLCTLLRRCQPRGNERCANGHTKQKKKSSHDQFVRVKVIVLDCVGTEPTEASAAKTYEIGCADSLPLEIPVTASIGDVALEISTRPVLTPLALATFIINRVPAGMGLSIETTIFMLSRLVVTL